ncbi:MAG TPA: NADH-quinone oxidoreductase subunit M, partial [Pirellulales bacterium]
GQSLARRIALVVSLVTLALAGWVTMQFDPATAATTGIDEPWFSSSTVDIRFSLGLDGISLWLFGLSALLTLTSVLVSWEAIEDRAPAFYSLLLLLATGMLGVFAARDIILFYVFFEFTLIPLFFLIGIWGSEERRYAAIKFFLFTLTGSLLTFLGLVAIVLWNYYHTGMMTFSIAALQSSLAEHPISQPTQLVLFLALFAGFAIKVPLFPLHTWLPLAHTQAPTAGSVILAGILLKIGSYGFLRFSIPMLPDATALCMPWLLWLSVAGIVYGALLALAQSNIKKMIAYSSVSHLGFCMLGTFALNKPGVYGGTLQMINHGLSTGGLFAIIGMVYERYHTREIADLGGLARRLPLLAAFMGLFTMSSIGLPGMNGFAGEFILLTGMFQRGYAEAPPVYTAQWLTIAVLAVSGVVLGAWYMLWLMERVFFNALREPAHHGPPVRDMKPREVLALAPLLVFIFWIGLAPQHFLRPMESDLDRVLAATERPMNERYPMFESRPVLVRGRDSGVGGQGPEAKGRASLPKPARLRPTEARRVSEGRAHDMEARSVSEGRQTVFPRLRVGRPFSARSSHVADVQQTRAGLPFDSKGRMAFLSRNAALFDSPGRSPGIAQLNCCKPQRGAIQNRPPSLIQGIAPRWGLRPWVCGANPGLRSGLSNDAPSVLENELRAWAVLAKEVARVD